MAFLKKYPVALILSILLIIVATLLSVNAKLGKECSEVENGFYNGVTFDGYAHPSIFNQLKNLTTASLGFESIAQNYGIDTSELADLRNHLETSYTDTSKYSISDVYKNYSGFVNALSAMSSTLKGTSLSERDSQGYTEYESILNGAVKMIDESGYNESVTEYINSKFKRFPTKILAFLSGVHAPELFA